MQFGDFITCGFNQIVNNLAKTHYRWGAEVPVVIRAPVGGGVGAGPFHSQCPEAWFTHLPGVKVVAPAFPEDARRLLLGAIDDPNPVLFLEHKLLYRSVRGEIAQGSNSGEDLGKAKVVRPGSDLTIITWSGSVHTALEAAEALAESDDSMLRLSTFGHSSPGTGKLSLHRSKRPTERSFSRGYQNRWFRR